MTGKYKYNRNDIDLDSSVVNELKGVHYLEKSAGIRRGSTALSLADHYHQANSDRVMGENGKRIYWLKRAAELGVAKAANQLHLGMLDAVTMLIRYWFPVGGEH